MSNTVQKTPGSGRQSVFFHDMASPVSSRRGKFASQGQAAAVSALWRENNMSSDLPPPPVFTLEDRVDLSPEPGYRDYPTSPDMKSDPRTPFQGSGKDFMSPSKGKSPASTSYALMGSQQTPRGSGSMNWWSPVRSDSEQEKGKGSSGEGVIDQRSALITLPPPMSVARPELPRNPLPSGSHDEEEWITVFGFLPCDTNLVLREFEKCGVILKHVPGPRDANWMHILYQNRADAQRALNLNGTQLNGALIIGVKPADPMQRHYLNERLNKQGFMPLPPPSSSRTSELSKLRVSSSPYSLQNGNSGTKQSGNAIALPAKSVASKIMDLMFGV
ncbi:unnamed protein product [Rhodiola kirilowii]